MRALSFVFVLLLSVAASAADIRLKPFTPAPSGVFPIDGLPYTFVTGFDASGNIAGVCGYGGYYNVHAWYNCTWDLAGTPLALGTQICCNKYGEHAPSPVYGPLMDFGNFKVWVVATDSALKVHHIGVADVGPPHYAVLVTQ
jgi:hypothetical protein